MGFLGGFTGHAVRRGLKTAGLRTDLIELEGGLTRVNIRLSEGGRLTEIHGSGPDIDPGAEAALRRRLALLGEGDLLVMAGHVPRPLADDYYLSVMRELAGRGVAFALGAAGEALAAALTGRPELVKANLRELARLTGTAPAEGPPEAREAAALARRLQAKGARNVLVPLGAGGALLALEGGPVLRATAAVGTIQDLSGAGDSLLAGYLAGRARALGPVESLKLASAAGSATAFSVSLADGPAVLAIVDQIEVRVMEDGGA
jgi:1-phosphofructokinase